MSFQFNPFYFGPITVNATATVIVALNSSRNSVAIANTGSVTVYVGDANVTTANGFPIAAGASLGLNTTSAVYGIVATGTGTVAYIAS